VRCAIIRLGAPLGTRRGRAVARITDEIVAAHRLDETVPMFGAGAAGVDIDIVVRSAPLARIDADRRLAAANGPRPGARRIAMAWAHLELSRS